MPLIIKNNTGTINHIENSEVTFNNGKITSKKKLSAEDVVDVPFEEVTSYCEYIVKEKFKSGSEYSISEFEGMLHKSSKQGAPKFVEFLRANERKGYLDFHGDSKQDVYDKFRAHFPDMKNYSYKNFAYYF